MTGLVEWLDTVPPILRVALLSIVPAVELSGAIPYGILATKLKVWVVVVTALAANWLVAPIAYYFMKYAVTLLERFKPFARFWNWYTERVMKKIHKSMEGWGSWALLFFIAVPGPGSGLYTCTVAAYLLGVSAKRYIIVAAVGQAIAAAIVTAVVLSGNEAFSWFIDTSYVRGAERP